jgi:hypothetical protein
VPGLGLVVVAAELLGQPEVGQVDVLARAEQDVGGLDVAVDEPGGVGGVQRGADLLDDPHGALGREAAFAPHQRSQVIPGDVAHSDVRDPVLVARVEDRDDVRVVDGRRELGFPEEALARRSVFGESRRDDLEGDRPVERQLGRAVDDAHPSPSRDRVDPVLGEHRARSEIGA